MATDTTSERLADPLSRLSDPQDPLFQALNSSIAFDYRLAPYDLEQSLAHARMLTRSGIISDADLGEIERGLEGVREEIEQDRFVVKDGDEDIHMAIERRLTELAGPVGGKLHTARSRNDQVATDVAMLVRAHTLDAQSLLRELMTTLIELAERHLDWPLPGYTHLQRAQPVYLSHHLLAYFWKFRRDLQRFRFCLTATDDLPLGAGALAGVNFDTGRMFVAQELGFGGIAENSLDAVSNRDFVLDYMSAAATCSGHLSQLGGELVLWSTAEFGFCRVSDSFASGSSLMPQKKNPDAAELLRAKAPRVVGNLVGLHGVLHGLPLTYNKDLQEDKEPLFDTIDTVELSLRVARAMLAEIEFDRERMAAAASDELIAATDIADQLVRQGVPFREAHGIVGGVVRASIERGKRLSELSDEELAELAPQLRPEDFRALLEQSSWLESKVSEGGTSLERVREQLAQARHVLEEAPA
ncbi:MAG: argininosuccinate lyase [Thermoleophilaceae bacterium]|nr:argininosuccinate lyase [Thermoleophilaceae bacterium]